MTKVPDKLDGRAYYYQVTELGMSEYTAYREARLKSISKLTGEWSDEEREQFGRLLVKFNRSLEDKT